MRILHICLTGPYTDGYSYQDNIIPKYHKKFGNDVTVLTINSCYEKGRIKKISCGTTISKDGFKIIRINPENGFLWKLRWYRNLYNIIEKVGPNIIFIHGMQFVSLIDVTKYIRKHSNVSVYADNHADFYNTPVDSLKRCILHKVIYKYNIKLLSKYVNKFWGTTPWRCQYLNEIYKIPKEKIGLLVTGGDDENIHFEKIPQLRNDIRRELNIADDDFVIVTGGKIDRAKNIHNLMQAVKEINDAKLKLVVFGQPDYEMEDKIEELAKDRNIRYIGWLSSDDVYDYFLASDLAVFPGTHSVLWEQACACGIPCVFKSWDGMKHVDVGGNCVFLEKDDKDSLKDIIYDIYTERKKYESMKKIAEQKGIEEFSYKNISGRAIEI